MEYFKNGYMKRVRANILSLSICQNLLEAFDEWYFTGHVVDHEDAVEMCELCNQEELRYHFKIANRENYNSLMVGYRCILKFNVAVYEKGVRLSPDDTKKKLDSLINSMRFDSCINALQKTTKTEEFLIRLCRVEIVELKGSLGHFVS